MAGRSGREADAPLVSAFLPPPLCLVKAADVPGTKLAVVAVVRVCFQCKAWAALNENVLLLSKRRAQLKQARSRAGRVCCVSRHSSLPPSMRRPSPQWCRSA